MHNVTMFDAVMASSAAPTFFPGHSINGKVYVDGGLQANSPASVALDTALRSGVEKSTVKLWSLGTGDHVTGKKLRQYISVLC